MSDALSIPARPNLEQYRKLAKDLQQACSSNDRDAFLEWAARWPENEVRGLVRGWEQIKGNCQLTDAQFYLARSHGFASWPKFIAHVRALMQTDSSASRFELAADAIASGEIETIRKLLGQHPEMIRERSSREHHSTLLHYVSANGIENYRQRTPKNIVETTKLLLDAGAEVNAESDAYGGRSTALNLTATSFHPEQAGVQLDILDELLRRGARIQDRDVVSCLHNGRGDAAAFLASRGASLDLEGATGTGVLEEVKKHFHPDRALKPPATVRQMHEGFGWACEFNRVEVVHFLLDHGLDLTAQVPAIAPTGLHWAAYGGYVEIVKLLLDREAPVNIREKTHGGTPLAWALHRYSEFSDPAAKVPFYEVVRLLVRAGASVGPDEMPRTPLDPEMLRALDQ